jgi:membrane-associated phospholipid phosphatase
MHKAYACFSRSILLLIFVSLTLESGAQNSRFKPFNPNDSVYQVTGKKLIIPAVLTGFGFSQFMSEPIRSLNLNVRNQFTSRVAKPVSFDDYIQYTPALALYGLDLLGIRGKHNFIDRSVIIGTSAIITFTSVEGIKALTHLERPDESSYDAFPSGHTATAFACAEFLAQEYKDISIWYGIAGYTVAAGTGFFRMYNNRHWLTDVVAGAAFGILSTKLAYWIFPKIRKLYSKDIQISFSIAPPINLRNGPVR